jgi:nitroreductase
MDILELMKERHAVRSYLEKPIEAEKRQILNNLIEEANQESGLHLQACFDEPEAFSTGMAHYGKFVNVRNYLIVAGKRNQEETGGYYGEKLVLKAQELGLSTCWVALTYGKRKAGAVLEKGEKIFCVIALGYGAAAGVPHHSKQPDEVSQVIGTKRDFFDRGVEAALLAPTAMNQQKFQLVSNHGQISIKVKGLGFYTKIDLGIVKYHFEAATGEKIDG